MFTYPHFEKTFLILRPNVLRNTGFELSSRTSPIAK